MIQPYHLHVSGLDVIEETEGVLELDDEIVFAPCSRGPSHYEQIHGEGPNETSHAVAGEIPVDGLR